MRDLVFVGVIVAFVALAYGFVLLCDRLVGRPEEGR